MELIKFSTKIRLEIYQAMLREWILQAKHTEDGFCRWFTSSEKSPLYHKRLDLDEQFPELYAQRELQASDWDGNSFGMYWPAGNREIRIQVLKKAIELLQNSGQLTLL